MKTYEEKCKTAQETGWKKCFESATHSSWYKNGKGTKTIKRGVK